MTVRYSKFTRAVSTSKTMKSQIASLSAYNWIMQYGIPRHVLKNEMQFVSKLLETLCTFLRTKHLTTMAYHPQTNGQSEQFNETTIAILCHCGAQLQQYWYLYVQLLTCAYNAQRHRSINLRHFSLVLLPHPLSPTTFDALTALPTDIKATTTCRFLRSPLLHRIAAMQNAPTKKWRRRNGITKSTTTKTFSMHQNLYKLDSTCTLIGHK